jgi:hypothetical protein
MRDLLCVSTVTPPAPALSVAPLLLLCGPLCHRQSPRAAPSLAPPRCPVASALRPPSPDSASTIAPTHGDHSLGWGHRTRRSVRPWRESPPASPPATVVAPRCRWQRRPHRDTMHVASVYFKCFRFFRCMLQVFHKDVAKVDGDVAHFAMGYAHMFQVYVPNISSTSDICCKCFI